MEFGGWVISKSLRDIGPPDIHWTLNSEGEQRPSTHLDTHQSDSDLPISLRTSNRKDVELVFIGVLLYRLSFLLTGVCVVSALSYGTSLVLAGGVGVACGPHGNLSELLQHVVDDNTTWGGAHLLGGALLRNASYPLTFEGALVRCGRNRSLYQSFQLHSRFPLDDYFFISKEHKVCTGNSL